MVISADRKFFLKLDQVFDRQFKFPLLFLSEFMFSNGNIERKEVLLHQDTISYFHSLCFHQLKIKQKPFSKS